MKTENRGSCFLSVNSYPLDILFTKNETTTPENTCTQNTHTTVLVQLAHFPGVMLGRYTKVNQYLLQAINSYIILISAPRLGVYYFLSLTLSVCQDVCPFVCHAPSDRFFFFVSRWNRAIFRPPVLHVALYKTLFLDF